MVSADGMRLKEFLCIGGYRVYDKYGRESRCALQIRLFWTFSGETITVQ